MLKIIAFNANGIWRRRYELSKHLQDLHIDVALLSNPMKGSSFQIITFTGLTASREEEAFPITMHTYALCAIRTLDKDEAYS
jgi:hypothetical protein